MEKCLVDNCNKRRSGRHVLCSMHRYRKKRYNSYELPIHKPRTNPACSERMKLSNPMFNETYKQKAINSLKKINHKPIIQGGNGRGLSIAQEKLLMALGSGWFSEYVVKTMLKREDGYPYHYKIDIANPGLHIAIEIDGTSHNTLKQREKDLKKTDVLQALGWKVLRFSNKSILDDCLSMKRIIHENT